MTDQEWRARIGEAAECVRQDWDEVYGEVYGASHLLPLVKLLAAAGFAEITKDHGDAISYRWLAQPNPRDEADRELWAAADRAYDTDPAFRPHDLIAAILRHKAAVEAAKKGGES